MSEFGVLWLTFGTYYSFLGFPHPKPPVPKGSPNLVGVMGGQGRSKMRELGVLWLSFGTYHSFLGFPYPKLPVPKGSPNLVGWVKGVSKKAFPSKL